MAFRDSKATRPQGNFGDRNNRAPQQTSYQTSARPQQRVLGATPREKRLNAQVSLAASHMKTLAVGSVADYALGNNPRANVNSRAENYQHGDVVMAPYVVPCLNGEATNTDVDIAISTIIGPISAKSRPQIVIGILPLVGLLCIPLFSSTKRGLLGVPEYKRDQCLHVLSSKAPEETVRNVRPGEVIRALDDENWKPSDGSFVYASQTNLLDFAYPIRVIGAVDSSSVRRLQKWHEVYLHKGFLPIQDQKALMAQFKQPHKG